MDNEVRDTIEKTAKTTAEEVVSLLKNKNMIKNGLTYTKKVEIALYNYNNLLEAVKEKDEAIEELETYGVREKSHSVTVYSSSAGMRAEQDVYIEKIQKLQFEKKETLRNIKRIDKALSKIKKDKYYQIIEWKYFKQSYEENGEKVKYTDEKIAEMLDVERITIIRNRKRLINTLTTIIIPNSIEEMIS